MDSGGTGYGTNCAPAFRVEAFDRQRDRLAERPGAEVVYEREAAGHHWLVFEDPEGSRVGICEH